MAGGELGLAGAHPARSPRGRQFPVAACSTASVGDRGSRRPHRRRPTGRCIPTRCRRLGLYEQLALVVEDLQIKVDRRDRGREPIACTGMPEAPGTPAA